MANSTSLPVWRIADVIVLGTSMAAVSSALAARESGSQVILLGDGTFPGQDFAGDLHVWEDGEADPLVRETMAACTEFPARPAALKRALENRLLAAGISFLYSVRPVGLLYDECGNLQGVVCATRTSLFAVLSSQVIDATPFGLGARLAALPMTSREADSIAWRVLASKEPEGWPGSITALPVPYVQNQAKEGRQEYAAFELGISRSQLGSDSRNLEHSVHASLVDESVWYAASHLIDPGTDVLASMATRPSADDLRDGDFDGGRGLWIANRLLAVGDLGALTDPSVMSAVGRRVGRLAANATGQPQTSARSLIFQSGRDPANGRFAFSSAFIRRPEGEIELESIAFPDWDEFDVVVAGGGTGGAPAAIAAARAGSKTLCLEAGQGLGGVGTLGLISSYWFGNKVGFTAELTSAVCEVDALSRSKKGNSWRPEIKSGIYHRMLRQAHGAAWLGSFAFGVRLNGSRPDGVLVSTPYGCGFVRAKALIDATSNADVAAASGAKCRMIDNRHVAVQGTGISPRNHPAVPHQNSDHTFVEENDPEGLTAAHIQARAKYPDAFETAAFVNSRERRQIVGDLEISPLDILAERRFPDTVFTARSNFDTHGFIIHPVFMVTPPDHGALEAHVPLRCMLPVGVDGLIVTGLGMSAHRDALPVIRMQADVQNQGYAAGLLAAQCAASGEDFRQVNVRKFQQKLVEVGIISSGVAEHVDSFPLGDADVEAALAGNLSEAKNVAIIFAHHEACRERLVEIMRADSDPARSENAALILGLLGDESAAESLSALIEKSPWDEGWNYRGMGQFGACMSRLDALVIALGRCGSSAASVPLIQKVGDLDATADFSHCRALALACESLKCGKLSAALCGLLDLPGMSGHAFHDIETMLVDSDDSTISTRSRNLALRELYLARGVFHGGDVAGRGAEILMAYATDLRGHFARHARAVLDSGSTPVPLCELA